MKELITGLTGGRPFLSDDLTLLNDTLKEMTSIIANGLAITETAIILTGCNITVNGSGGATPTLDLTEGAIWYLDEIYQVDAVTGQSLPANTTQADVEDTYEWDLLESITLTGTYKDNISKNLHKLRKSVLLHTSITWTGLSGLKTISDVLVTPTATETLKGKAEIATVSETETGSDDERIVTPQKLIGITGGIKRKVLDIGDWNMDADDFIFVVHGLDYTKIRNVTATIVADSSSTPYPLNRMDVALTGLIEGEVEFTNFSQVKLTRRTAGFFDSTIFDDTSYNRGWVIIDYVS